MIKGLLTAAATIAMASAIATSAPAATNLLTNGSFENGFNGWTTAFLSPPNQFNGNPVVITYNQPAPTPNTPSGVFTRSVPTDTVVNANPDAAGNQAVYFYSDFQANETISQSVSGLVAGNSYTFGFDYYLPYQSNANDATLTAVFDGVTIGVFSTATANPITGNTWQTASASYIAPNANGVFSFTFNSTTNPARDYIIDRVYLIDTTQIPAVPEPASWAMMVAGFGLMGTAMRRKRTSVSFA